MVLGAVFVGLHVVESAAPMSVGDDPDPASDASLVLTGFVLVALLAALMLPAEKGR